jgi:threonine efflux protein
MEIIFTNHIKEILSVAIIAIFMAISPGADFVMVTRNSILHSRLAGLYSSLGVSLAIWVHVSYSIAGLAVIISNSIVLFSIIKYFGAAYLIYLGWKTFYSNQELGGCSKAEGKALSNVSAFKIGFATNVLNPKTTIFFLSIFTQVINSQTTLSLQIFYGAIISTAHLIWFSIVAIFLSQPLFLRKLNEYKTVIEKCVGSALFVFGLKIAVSKNN